jgi:hypothetical protein
MTPKNEPVTLFQLEAMRLREGDAEMLLQIEKKNGAELVAFVSDWWSTRSRQILLEMCDVGAFNDTAARQVAAHLNAQEQISWRDLPEEWRRQFGVRLEV